MSEPIITAEAARLELQKIWPVCQYFITDGEFKLVSSDRVKQELLETYIEQYKYRAEDFDCDDYALILHAWVRQGQYKEKAKYAWAFGEMHGYLHQPDGSIIGHALNVVITSDKGVQVVEPQTDELRDPGPEFTPWFVRM